jgi:tripartite-type tricarboxylate transporter receptor subunit TctC
MTPVSMLALDQFVLWVNAETPYKTAKEYIAAVKAAGPSKMKMGGTGSKQEDQIITVGLEKAPAPSSSTSRTRAAARWPCNWWASTSTRR